MKKSRVVRLKCFATAVRRIADLLYEDRVSVYAAQASFFVIISAVPFLSLLFALFGTVAPEALTDTIRELIPGAFHEMLDSVLADVRNVQGLSLLSISAVTSLWSASKGIAAVRSGVQTVYRSHQRRGLWNRLYSLLYTLIFIVMILSVVVILVFGDFLERFLYERFGLTLGVIRDIFRYKTLIFTVFMTFVFAVMYVAVARRSSMVSNRFLSHLPGAVLASLGWNVFSYVYSLYLTRVPHASSIYGSLAAICLIMLWLYFCMIILLCGAEVNKICYTFRHPPRGDQAGRPG